MTIAQPTATRIHRCERWPDKIQHRDLTAAFAEVDRVKEARKVQLHVYACSHCGYFHLSKSSGKPGPGSDDINVGRKVHRGDIPLWIASRKEDKWHEPVRDQRYTGARTPRGEAIEACQAALRAHKNPATIKAVELAGWAGITRDRATKALQEMGWVPTGATKSRIWHRTSEVAEVAETVVAETKAAEAEAAAVAKALAKAAAEPEWVVVDLNAVKDVTVDQLARVFKIAGKYVEIRVRAR